eukprot:6460616-Amphidinium_carterae.1
MQRRTWLVQDMHMLQDREHGPVKPQALPPFQHQKPLNSSGRIRWKKAVNPVQGGVSPVWQRCLGVDAATSIKIRTRFGQAAAEVKRRETCDINHPKCSHPKSSPET